MLAWAVAFLILALVSGFFGFTGIVAGAVNPGQSLFFLFFLLFIAALALRRMRL